MFLMSSVLVSSCLHVSHCWKHFNYTLAWHRPNLESVSAQIPGACPCYTLTLGESVSNLLDSLSSLVRLIPSFPAAFAQNVSSETKGQATEGLINC